VIFVLQPALHAEAIAYRLLPRVEPGRSLASEEWTTLVRLAEVLLEGSPVAAEPERVADNVERFLTVGRSRRAWRCRLLFHLVEYSSLLTHGRPFSALSRVERRHLIEQHYVNGQHVFRLCAKVRYLVLMGAYGDASAAAATGFVPLEQRERFREARSRSGMNGHARRLQVLGADAPHREQSVA
jgi:hypothetical protein